MAPSDVPSDEPAGAVVLRDASATQLRRCPRSEPSIALDTFKRLSKSKAERNRRTSVTYSLFFKAFRKLVESGSERDAIARKMFAFCIAVESAGHVTDSVTCSESVVADLLSSNGASSITTMPSSSTGGSVPPIDVALLPSTWTCNAGR